MIRENSRKKVEGKNVKNIKKGNKKSLNNKSSLENTQEESKLDKEE